MRGKTIFQTENPHTPAPPDAGNTYITGNRPHTHMRMHSKTENITMHGSNKKYSLRAALSAALSLCLLAQTLPQISAAGGEAMLSVSSAESESADGFRFDSREAADAALLGVHRDGSMTVIENADSRLYESSTDLIIDNQAVGWSSAGMEISSTSGDSVYPYRSLYGGLCMQLHYPHSDETSVCREFAKFENDDEYVIAEGPASGSPEGIDFHSVSTVSFAVNLCSSKSETMFVEIYVSEYLVFTERFTVSGNGWNAVFADISGVHGSIYGPAAIARVVVGVERGDGDGDGTLMLDGLAFSREDAAHRYLMLSNDVSVNIGGELNALYRYTFSNETFVLTFDKLRSESFSGCSSLSVLLMHDKPVGSMTCTYMTDGSYGSAVPAYEPLTFAPSGGNITVYTFPLPDKAPESLQLTLSDGSGGDVSLLGIVPAYLPCSDGLLAGSCDSCRYNSGTGEITISGSLDTNIAAKYSGSKIYVYALDPWQSSDTATLTPLSPVASVGVDETFSVKLRVDGYMSKKFTAVIRTGDGMTIVFRDHGITPSAAKERQAVPNAPIKGISGDPTDAALLGSSCAVLELDIASLLSAEPTTESITIGGDEYYFRPERLTELDSAVRAYDGLGSSLLLRLQIPSSSGEISMLSTGSRGGSYMMPDTRNEQTVRAYSAVIRVLTERFNGKSALAGYVVGADADTAVPEEYAADGMLAEYSARCAELLRITYTASDCAVPVYLPLSSRLTGGLSADGRSRYPASLLLTAVAAQTRIGGELPWSVLLTVPADAAEGEEVSADRMSGADISLLCDMLLSPSLEYSDMPRRISVYAVSGGAGRDSKLLSAGLIHLYLSLIGKEAPFVGEFICSSELIKRVPSDVLTYIDTSSASELLAKYAALYDSSCTEWSELIDESALSLITKAVTSVKADSDLPFYLGSAELFDLSGTAADGWRAGVGCQSLGVSDILGHKNALVAKLEDISDPSHRCIRSVFEYTRDLSPFDSLSTEAFVSQLPDSIESVRLDIMLYSGSSYIISSCSVTPGEWNRIILPLSDYPALKSTDRMVIMLRGEGGEYIGSPTMMISSPVGLSARYEDAYLENYLAAERTASVKSPSYSLPLVYIMPTAVILLLCIALLVIRAGRRANRHAEQDKPRSRFPKDPPRTR